MVVVKKKDKQLFRHRQDRVPGTLTGFLPGFTASPFGIVDVYRQFSHQKVSLRVCLFFLTG